MEEQTWEQPEIEEKAQGAQAQEGLGDGLSSLDGSLGKFKDAQSLYSAYNSLQAEFTRKCQRLSELEKTSVSNQDVQDSPVYKDENWSKQVVEFLEKNQDAKPFAKEICDEIMLNEDLSKSKDALSLAWANVIKKNYKSPSDVESDDFIENYILSNEKITQRVAQLLANRARQNNLPKMVGKTAGSHINLPTHSQPLTLEDAKEMLRKMID